MRKLTTLAHQVLVNLVELSDGTKPWYRLNGNGRIAAKKLTKLGLVRDLGSEITVTELGREYVQTHGR